MSSLQALERGVPEPARAEPRWRSVLTITSLGPLMVFLDKTVLIDRRKSKSPAKEHNV